MCSTNHVECKDVKTREHRLISFYNWAARESLQELGCSTKPAGLDFLPRKGSLFTREFPSLATPISFHSKSDLGHTREDLAAYIYLIILLCAVAEPGILFREVKFFFL
jgi:hypothetical protein